jgi:serine/threonine-protein kinase
MTVSTNEFWGLLQSSQLVSAQELARLQAEFTGMGGASSQGNATTLAEWLVSKSIIEPFHRSLLLDGNDGPFLFGDYLLTERLTQPAMDGWFQARHRSSGHPVVLQFLAGQLATDTASWDKLVKSVEQHASITDRLVQQVYEPLDLGNYRLVVYEMVAGVSLREQIAGNGGIDFAEACKISWTVAQALAQLHQRGLIHGSLSPDSIILTPDGGCRLLRSMSPTSSPLDLNARPQDPEWLRLADYLAPELGQIQHQACFTTDVYALGCCFYEMLTGQPPYRGGGLIEKMRRHAATVFPSLPESSVSTNVDRLISYLVDKDPARRYPQAGDIPEKLQLLVPTLPLQLTPIPIPQGEASYQQLIKQPVGAPRPVAPTPAAPVTAAAPITAAAPPTLAAEFEGVNVTDERPDGGESEEEDTGSEIARARQRRRRRSLEKSPVFWGMIGTAALAVVLFLVYGLPPVDGDGSANDGKVAEKDNGKNKKPAKKNGTSNPPKGGIVEPAADNNPKLVDDDGTLLWESPTAGSQIQLNWLPPGPQLLIAARPSELMAHGGEDVLRALGPAFAGHLAGWEAATGIKISAVKRIVMGLYNNDEEFPRPAFVVELSDPISSEQLIEGFGEVERVQVENGSYYKGREYSFVVPEMEGTSIFLMGHEDNLVEALKFPGNSPPISPSLAKLLKLSDDSRHFTMIFVPTFLTTNMFRDGRTLAIGTPRRLRTAIEWILDDAISSGLVSMHLDSVFYLEAKLYSGLTRNKFELASKFKEKMSEVPEKILNYIVILNPHLHWRKVAFEYPQMIRELHAQTRVGVDGGVAMVNTALPPLAASHLLLGAEFCLVAEPTSQLAVTPENTPTKFKSIQELLKLKMGVDIPQQDLNLAVVDIENQVKEQVGNLSFPFTIKILGDDLRLAGITRNQAIRDFKAVDKPFGELLTGLVMKANPDPTVTDPSQPKQKLLWVLGPDPAAPDNTIILLTTRTAAMDTARKYEIPDVFKPK